MIPRVRKKESRGLKRQADALLYKKANARHVRIAFVLRLSINEFMDSHTWRDDRYQQIPKRLGWFAVGACLPYACHDIFSR